MMASINPKLSWISQINGLIIIELLYDVDRYVKRMRELLG